MPGPDDSVLWTHVLAPLNLTDPIRHRHEAWRTTEVCARAARSTTSDEVRMDDDTWDGRLRRHTTPRWEKARDEARRRRPYDALDRRAENRSERRRVDAAVRYLVTHGGDPPDERLDTRMACARRARRAGVWADLQTRRERWVEQDRRRIADIGMRWFYHRYAARRSRPERFTDDSLSRHAWTLVRTESRHALPLALRWERWLSADLEFPSERLAFCGGVAPCNDVVARMLTTRPALRQALEAWIRRVRAEASAEALADASWIQRLQGVW
ncbi:MAG: hypothetical protein R3F59_31190 [Myxococcota bacterium]